MYGLRSINNVYVPDGSGRDWLILGHPEFVKGRSYAPRRENEGKRLCMPPRKTPGSGPRPLTPARIEAMKLGLNPIEVEAMRKSGSLVGFGKLSKAAGGASASSKKLSKSASAPSLAK